MRSYKTLDDLFEQPQYTLDPEAVRSSLCLALDDVQDPGNLGTIIRLADWFAESQEAGARHCYPTCRKD